MFSFYFVVFIGRVEEQSHFGEWKIEFYDIHVSLLQHISQI